MIKIMMQKKRDRRGMTLVELLVVMAMLSFVMLAVLSLYIPAHQSTVAQTQVSDIQSNLRLAMRVMTQDLLNAGFLEQEFPVVFTDASGGVTNPTAIGTQNSADFVIRTRIIGNDFGRVAEDTGTGISPFTLELSGPDMTANFPVGSIVRLFEPISARELEAASGSDAARAYPVTKSGTADGLAADEIQINTSAMATVTSIQAETVVVRIRDASQPPLQTIRYRLNNGALERIHNGVTQYLSRNIDTSDTAVNGTSFFDFDYTNEGKVKKVEVHLSGKTRALKNDAISGAKTRELVSMVKLRNVF